MAELIITLHSYHGGKVNESYLYDLGTGQIKGSRITTDLMIGQTSSNSSNLYSRNQKYGGAPVYFANVFWSSRTNDTQPSVGATFMAPNEMDSRGGLASGVTIRFPSRSTITDAGPIVQLVRLISEAFEKLLIKDGIIQGQLTSEVFKEIRSDYCPPELIRQIGQTIAVADTAAGPYARLSNVRNNIDYGISVPDSVLSDRDVLAAAARRGINDFFHKDDPNLSDAVAIGGSSTLDSMGGFKTIRTLSADDCGRLPSWGSTMVVPALPAEDNKVRSVPEVTGNGSKPVAGTSDIETSARRAADEITMATIAGQATTALIQDLKGPNGASARRALEAMQKQIQAALAGAPPPAR